MFVIFFIVSYLVGSVPCGVIVAKALGAPDPRKSGSGNIGATNVHRTLGRGAGVATLVGDIAKGALPAFFALYFYHDPQVVAIAGFSAFIGHLFPVFLGFKGGKGVATASGVLLVVSPLALLFSVVVFAFFLYRRRYVSLGSITSAASMPIILFLLGADKSYIYMGVAIGILIIIKHSDNIKRLKEGKENKLGGGL